MRVYHNNKEKKFIHYEQIVKQKLDDFTNGLPEESKKFKISDLKTYLVNDVTKEIYLPNSNSYDIDKNTLYSRRNGVLFNAPLVSSFYMEEEYQMHDRIIFEEKNVEQLISLINTNTIENKKLVMNIIENSNIKENLHHIAYLFHNNGLYSSIVTKYLTFYNNNFIWKTDVIIRTISNIVKNPAKTQVLISKIKYA